MAEPFDDTTKAFYRSLFQGWGMKAEAELEVFARGRSIDLVVDCSPEDHIRLRSTVFAHFRTVNALEFKGPADPLTLVDYNRIMMRAWGLGAMERRPRHGRIGRKSVKNDADDPLPMEKESLASPANRTVTVVCVGRPDRILDDPTSQLMFQRTAESGIYLSEGQLHVWIIVPAELALAKRNYMLLPLSRGKKLQDFIALCVQEGEIEYLRMALDAGVVTDPMMVWSKVLEVVQMQPVWTDEVYEIIDKVVQEIPTKLPSIRHMMEEVRSVQERLNAAEENARAAEKRGLEAGEKHGLEEGELKSRRETLVRMLTHRFGAVPPEMLRKIQLTTDLPVLDGWMEQVLDVNKLEEMNFAEPA